MFSTFVGVHSYQYIHYFGCKRAVSNAIFHLFCTFIQGPLAKCKKKHSIYPTETFSKSQCQLLSMFDMYRSLALLCI